MAESEVQGSVPKGTGPLFWPVPIFLGQLSHQCDSPPNRSIQILARRVPFDKTDVRTIVLG
jgi:hypothetical protein